jgi:Ca2+-binding EF-hand superfamily protein
MRLIKILGLSAALVFTAATALAQDVDVMQYADTNGDGKVTLEEYTAFMGQAWDYLMMSADKVKAADVDPMAKGLIAGITPDADGYITKAAFLAAAPAKFKAADKNGDGVLDAAELNASMKAS